MTNGILTVNEYIEKEKAKKHEYILQEFKSTEATAIGKISIPENYGYYFIEKFFPIVEGSYRTLKLFQEQIQVKDAFGPKKRLLAKNIKNEDYVIFEFDVEERKEHILDGKVLVVKDSTVSKLDNQALDLLLEENKSWLESKIFIDKGIYTLDYITNTLLKNAFTEKQTEIEKKEIDLLSKEKEFTDIEKNIQEEKETLITDRENFDKQQEEFNKQQQEFEEKSRFLRDLNLLMERKTPIKSKVRDVPEVDGASLPYHVLLALIQRQLFNLGYNYEIDTLRRYLGALRSGELVILNGPSGTGKTSLVNKLGELLGLQTKIIPVQPNWMDKQDLIGTYDPIRKLYYPSTIVDTLVAAENDPDTIFVVCLDELNLGKVEYYFADFLSLKEQGNLELELYSQLEYEMNCHELSFYLKEAFPKNLEELVKHKNKLKQNQELTIEKKVELAKRLENLYRFPSRIPIPKNVRFVGTMNMDGSITPLSPKVVDRSYIIELQEQTKELDTQTEPLNIYLPKEFFEIKTNESNTNFTPIQVHLDKLNAGFSSRVKNHYYAYMAAHDMLEKNQHKLLVDDLFQMKFLPRINYYTTNEKVVDEFVSHINLKLPDSITAKKVAKMRETYLSSKVFSYWS